MFDRHDIAAAHARFGAHRDFLRETPLQPFQIGAGREAPLGVPVNGNCERTWRGACIHLWLNQ